MSLRCIHDLPLAEPCETCEGKLADCGADGHGWRLIPHGIENTEVGREPGTDGRDPSRSTGSPDTESLAAAHAALKRSYGAKFNAISAALGWATEAQERLIDDDTEACGVALDKVVSILVDA